MPGRDGVRSMPLQIFLQHLANAISLGSIYALIAIGYSMVYGILQLINFAHGDIFMLSCYIAFYAIGIFSLPWYLAFLVAIVLTAAVGVVIERVAYRPLRDSPRVVVLISAVGISFLLENVGVVVFGGRPKTFVQPDILATPVHLGSVAVMGYTFVIPLVTLTFLLLLTWLVYRTKTGMAMRAVAYDFEVARLMGIDVNRIVSVTFAVGSALAAVGGMMWGVKFPQIQPLMGVFPGLKCFIAAVFGGVGSIGGAVLGGFLLGIGEIMLVAFLPGLAGYRDAFAFVLLVIVLLFKPTGILGEKRVVKV